MLQQGEIPSYENILQLLLKRPAWQIFSFCNKVSHSEQQNFILQLLIHCILNLKEGSFNIGMNPTPSHKNQATYFGTLTGNEMK